MESNVQGQVLPLSLDLAGEKIVLPSPAGVNLAAARLTRWLDLQISP